MGGSVRKYGEFMGVVKPKNQQFNSGPINTGYSFMDGQNVNIDPSIRQMQNASYGELGDATSRFLGTNSDLRNSLAGNQGAYMQARVNPILQRFATLRGQTQQNLGMRKLSGSSFADQSMRNIDLDASRAEGDARALATNESAAALSGLDAAALEASSNKANFGNTIAQQRLQQELSALGLGLNQNQQDLMAWQTDQALKSKAYDQMMNSWFKHNETAQNWIKTFKGGMGGGGSG